MRIHRFFHPGPLVIGEEVILNASASRHAGQALRLRENQIIYVFDGQGCEFEASIISARRQLKIKVNRSIIPVSKSSLSIHLGQCISRGDRMDYAIQKACELGVESITPLISQHCQLKVNPERLTKKHRHWLGVIISACEQSGRADLPELYEAEALASWLRDQPTDTWVCVTQNKNTLSPEHPKGPLRLCIGPEGGFSESELDLMKNLDLHALGLGPRILRTETATTVALTLMQANWGDLCYAPSE